MASREQAQPPGLARRVAAGGLRRIGRWAESTSDRLVARDDSLYAALWKPIDETEAILQIYNTSEEASFEEGGRWDFESLAPFLTPSSTVLDLGCGIGRVARYVAPACAKLWAVDVSSRMLELAASRLSSETNIQYALCKDVCIPDVPSGTVDLAYSFLVLQHVEREDAFLLLEELRRVVRPTGTVVLTFPNLLSDTYLECFRQYARAGVSTLRNRARVYTPQEVERIMTAAGFEPTIEAATEIRVTATLR
jgi:ubiquinone/menaquinone biosynthesis C-methylase UbiE